MRILLIDDERSVRQTLTTALQVMQHQVTAVADGASALRELQAGRFDLVLLDLFLSEENGLDLLPRMARPGGRLAVVMTTAHASYPTAVEAVRRGAFDYLPKPCTPDELRSVLARVDEKLRAAGERPPAGDGPPPDFASESAAVRRVFETAMQAARTDATVLLLGETGTGKSVLAREIHRQSSRGDGPLLTVNCPSLSPGSLEGDLLSRANSRSAEVTGGASGDFNGTLFLDEIGDLPLPLQAAMLQLLKETEDRPSGESSSPRAALRVIAATNRNLAEETAARRFREDLYYRLMVLPIVLPPLRERLCDLPKLARRLLAYFAARNHTSTPTLSAPALRPLQAYPWPGNLRELRNLLERAVIVGTGETIGPDDLLPQLQSQPEIHLGSRLPLARIEAEHIRKILKNTSSLEEAATVLEIDPATLYRKRKRQAEERREPH